ncbi:GLT1 [Symbiodinium sp. CCMP2592]|nr:GLT1 [Symbiodinium sp. CCMP2592]
MSGDKCLTTGPFCEPPTCTAESVISNNVASNDNRLESSRSGGYVVDLQNGDTVWSQNTYGSNQRGLGQAFDASSARDWNRAWHGKCHGPDYKAAPLQLRYTFKSGNHVITSVKVWNVPGAGHHAGKVDVKYWTGSDWEDVTNQSLEGFTEKIDTEEIEIKFDAVTTSQFRLDFWAHATAGNPTCVGATEVQIIGCKGP